MIQQNTFDKMLFSSRGLFMDWKSQTEFGHDKDVSQSTFTCLKSTNETLEKGVKFVQSQQ